VSSFAASPREGLIRSARQLEQSALALLGQRLLAYGQAVARQEGMPEPAPPRSFTAAGGIDRWAEDQLPAVVVACPGTIGRPEQRGGVYTAVYGLVVGIYVSAATESATHDLVRLWCAAARTCLAQAPSLGGLCSDLVLVDEAFTEMPLDDRRTIACGSVAWEARIDAITDANAGPLLGVDPPDSLPWAEVESVEVEVQRLPDDVLATGAALLDDLGFRTFITGTEEEPA
jgi:hypothetical protein